MTRLAQILPQYDVNEIHADPAYAKAAMNFHLAPTGGGGTRLSTPTVPAGGDSDCIGC